MAISSLIGREIPVGATQASDPSERLFQLTCSYIPCAALWVAAELKLADLIGAGSRSVAELAAETNANEDALFRILRVLATAGIFRETEPRHFALTPLSELLRSDHPQTLRDTVVFLADPLHFRVAAELLHSVCTGQPTIEHITGKPVFEYFPTDQVEFDRF